jgi:hypothetical protein
MIFGNPSSFAVEAVVEPGSEFPPAFGANVAGRMRVLVGGQSVGDINEPSCWLRPLSDHLCGLCVPDRLLWHPVLEGVLPNEQFEMLDEALFKGGGNPDLETCRDTTFLTNISEAFDPIKGFALSPSPERIVLLLKLEEGGPLVQCDISSAEFCGVADAFASWIGEQECTLLNRSTG